MAISTSHLFVFLSIAAIFAPSALATNYTVGDDAGWKVGVNYTNWAQNKTFYVGDNLIFKYQAKDDNVYDVNGGQFHNCTIPTDKNATNTGHDVVLLTRPGRKWFISGKEGHCAKNQKLVITVMAMAPASSPLPGGSSSSPPPPPPPPPPPASGAPRSVVSGKFGLVAVVVGILCLMTA